MKNLLPKQFRSVSDKDLLKKLEAGLALVEARLIEATTHADPVAKDATRHLVDAGGKRIRPVLVLLAAQLGNPNLKEVIDSAAVAEITHLATLYHDDVMDEAPTRRGVPTAHMVWGNNIAILTGDLLFARASQIAAYLGDEIIRLQSSTFERLCLGQMHETVGPREGENPIDHYIRVLADKTGSLISASAQMGLLASGGDRKYQESLIEFGESIGVAFQLIDDIIDIAEEGESGKTPGTDLRAGVPTLPVLLLRQQAQSDSDAAALLARIEGDLTNDETLAQVVIELRNHPAAEQAEAEARRWAAKAIAAIDPLPEGSVKQALVTFANAVVDRTN
ncbi:MAG: polyprenyl synthetase family protein [Rhodoluna sp.]|nr:polyprenyl synthetase family protein [Rhodoluna sp.]